ncbi:MAG TPA: alpha-L-arabinofuranosidase C-terminal domain-containing protein [Saprospiraceae bacterium]|nr:alpha-L-arabinofuranosidase C-terminal domain-containing protein [Saprospiraceae bacterium]HMQ82764.1 alpha-L-arabinofuranosidase C-terminal domain-containing protein [Saprospiraceae bacterium]
MRKLISCIAILQLSFFSASIFAQSEVQFTALPDPSAPIVSRHIYGHFAEHLGRCIYGGFYVGENSAIANTNGVRNDVVEALKELKIPNLRWPGGCFADTYHWKDGIGPKEERPSMLNIWWGNVREDNSFGTHEFLNMCELLGTEPYLSANVGSGTPQEMADWIKYTNHPAGSSPMPDLRKEYGREKPWKVAYWGVGNEAWGCGGNMTPEYYANVYRQFATFTTNWNNSDELVRVASGASSDDYNWTEVLMKNIPHKLLEAIALHHYSVIDWNNKGSATDFTEDQYFTTMQRAWEMENLIQKHTAIMDKYDPEKKVDLFVDEWGGWYDVEPGTNPGFLYQQNTMRDAMLAGMTLNIFNNHAERVKMANIAQTVNVLQAVILTDEEKIIRTPTFYVMKMYAVHHDAQLIPLQFQSPEYQYNGGKIPAITASASRNDQGISHFSIVNIHHAQSFDLELNVQALDISNFKGEILEASNLQDHNTFDQPGKVKPKVFKDFKLDKGKLSLKIPPFSVIVLEGSK